MLAMHSHMAGREACIGRIHRLAQCFRQSMHQSDEMMGRWQTAERSAPAGVAMMVLM